MDIKERIAKLKKEKNAVILAHNYQLPEIQDIADCKGDSLELSRKASETSSDVIVFCGVYFMAETAKILSPDKTVIIPDCEAGCPMADMITVDQLRVLKNKHPRAKVLCYVNTSAEVKAESDCCCTSANAITIMEEKFSKDDEIIFVPDKYLASYVALQTKHEIIMWQGHCPSHVRILPEDILRQKKLYPDAKVIVHPECNLEVIQLADEVLSTSGMLRYVRQTEAQEIIVGTEVGMLYPLSKENPDITFYPASELAVCPNMKRITLEKVLWSLEEMVHMIELSSEIISSAQKSIRNMLIPGKEKSLSRKN